MTEGTTTPARTERHNDSNDPVRVLVPIRSPSTTPSKRTLTRAKSLLERSGGELIIVHVNVCHQQDSIRWADLYQSVSAYLDDIDANYVVRQGVSVEDVILEEATDNDVDLIVMGKDTQPRWRRTINRVIGGKSDLASSLKDRAPCTVDIVV